jgi:trimeric autotransporter adhesin
MLKDERPRFLTQCVLVGGASLVCVLAFGMSDQPAASPPQLLRHGLERLPLVARGVVSAALGDDSRAYQVIGLRAINPAQRLRMRFSGKGVEIASARAHVSLHVVAYGRGTALTTPGRARVTVHKNTVKYIYDPFTEWFANGPRGLDQGFDVAAPPHGERGALTFAVALSGRLHARLRRGALLLRGGGASLRYGGLITTDAHGHVLRSWLVLAGDRLLIRVDDRGAQYPLRIDPFLEQSTLSDNPGASGENFGEAVAVSGRTLIVGTIHHIVPSNLGAQVEPGAAYVFTEPASGWAHARQVAIFKPPRYQSEEAFGQSVAISGNTIVVGDPFREVGRHVDQGAAYVFVKPAVGWRSARPTAQMTAAGGGESEVFGESVAISGNTVLVGAPGRKVGEHVFQGAVDVFALSRSPRAGAPKQLAQLTAHDGQANDALGVSVAIWRSTVVAGADMHRVGETAEQGVAYIFQRHGTGWRNAHATAQLADGAGQPRELFGRAVAIWHNTVVVGAPFRGGENPDQGAAFVFVKPASGWHGSHTQTAELTASDPGKNDQLGGALAIYGSLIVAGAPGHVTEQGAGYAFVKPATGWRTTTETGEITAASGAPGDILGESVALADGAIFLGAPNRAVSKVLAQGAVYAFPSDP